jgi:hypothetical protein
MNLKKRILYERKKRRKEIKKSKNHLTEKQLRGLVRFGEFVIENEIKLYKEAFRRIDVNYLIRNGFGTDTLENLDMLGFEIEEYLTLEVTRHIGNIGLPSYNILDFIEVEGATT